MQECSTKQLMWSWWLKYFSSYSVTSSADGLSFSYDGKSLEADVYTERNIYRCKKEMPAELKERLKLNFNVLYE